jgi:NAD(P)-dependent dehydrogenase (short-subunit alcohol dehydrogenase family)
MLDGKTCIVGGAGRGIGRATAIALGDAGANVIVNDLGASLQGEGEDLQPAEETAEAIRENGGEATVKFGDISDLEFTEEMIDDAVEKYGDVHGAVNFAGILRDSISYKMSGEEWDQVVRVHLRGHFSLLRNAAAHWREVARDEGGELDSQRSFVAVSSRSALGNVGQANYSAAKAGILGLMRATARELDRFNVRVNALVPTAYTRMIDEIPEEQRSFTREEMPPEKIGPVVGYLMSDAAEDVTGNSIRAAGDQVGLMSDPEIYRVGIKDGGWSVEDLAEAFESTVAEGENLDNSAPSH